MDWERFFNQHNIPFRTRGANISAGNVVIKCPFCGSRDKGEHMSVSLKRAGWFCYRDASHRGKKPAGLIAALLSVSFREAEEIASGGIFVPTDFQARIKAMLRPEEQQDERTLSLLPDFRDITNGRFSASRFMRYLTRRGFTKPNRTASLCQQFNIRYAVTGPFAERIIFPITHEDILVNWTGRDIGISELRYRTLSTDAEKSRDSGLPQALGPITEYLLFRDEALRSRAHTLVVVEGPFDAFKVWYLGQRHGVVAVCLFTNDASDTQLALLEDMAPVFERTLLLLDRGAYHKALSLKRRGTFGPQALPGLDLGLRMLPDAIKDPGEINNVDTLLKALDSEARA